VAAAAAAAAAVAAIALLVHLMPLVFAEFSALTVAAAAGFAGHPLLQLLPAHQQQPHLLLPAHVALNWLEPAGAPATLPATPEATAATVQDHLHLTGCRHCPAAAAATPAMTTESRLSGGACAEMLAAAAE
jgi:hypothetical protein